MDQKLLKYLGEADLHDGTIESFNHTGDNVVVVVQGYSGKKFHVTFAGVQNVDAVQPDGMLLYALAEIVHPTPNRKFVFAPSDDDSSNKLEIVAKDFAINLIDA